MLPMILQVTNVDTYSVKYMIMNQQ